FNGRSRAEGSLLRRVPTSPHRALRASWCSIPTGTRFSSISTFRGRGIDDVRPRRDSRAREGRGPRYHSGAALLLLRAAPRHFQRKVHRILLEPQPRDDLIQPVDELPKRRLLRPELLPRFLPVAVYAAHDLVALGVVFVDAVVGAVVADAVDRFRELGHLV